ncbi:hypothetical protein ACFWPY_30265 [Streptomyces sp. NPDC058527]
MSEHDTTDRRPRIPLGPRDPRAPTHRQMTVPPHGPRHGYN